MTMRETITAIVDANKCRSGEPIADAIIAAMPECVPDLAWEGCTEMRCETLFFSGKIYSNTVGEWTLDNGESVQPFDTIRKAKDAANIRNRAAVMAAFGV